MKMNRRELIALGAGATAATFLPRGTAANVWHTDRLTLRVGFNPGGSADTIGRLLADSIEKSTGWKVTVENVGGGGGIVMATGLNREKSDGKIIGLGVSSAMNYGVASDPSLPLTIEDFDYLGTVASSPAAIMAGADAPFDDMPGLVNWARQNGGAVVGVNERGAELIIRAIAKTENVDLKTISTRGGAEVLQNIMGGHIVAGFDGGRHVDYMTSGDMKMIAAATNDRHSYAPNVSTLKEQGFDYVLEPWFILMAPIGLPEDAKAAIATQINIAAQSTKLKQAVMNTFGVEPLNLGVEGTTEMMIEAYALANRLVAENS
ncbi:tripartite tricarboxylate transporter substrate binding protein [Paracoccus saliphilus]|uniref:Tripartite tricarboxylate transporter substrate binding protein n=1 Tax=Paracoccus saliphilus TaxID=405559 RepID=A0AA46A7E9_9RHOB|nr:tripartite tricarboxylate transporter substrate binding protein [Paracoccus saliphilus]WCR01557.1 tripartite tricarboxylate transporter substrate binding protein [Paracoccus saliphilus]SIT12445.1 Tripartite-type tricarboxylate transporter, receptor component TctC [Paracoccus saliphilus]